MLSLSDCLAIVFTFFFTFTFILVHVQLMLSSGVGPISRHNGPSPFPNNHISRPMPPPAYNQTYPTKYTQLQPNVMKWPSRFPTHISYLMPPTAYNQTYQVTFNNNQTFPITSKYTLNPYKHNRMYSSP